MALILNNTSRLIQLGGRLPSDESGKAGTPGYRPAFSGTPTVNLWPGATPVEDEVWKSFEGNKVIASMLKKDRSGKSALEVLSKDKITDFTPRDALELIEKTIDRKTLSDWELEDPRPLIKRAIGIQLGILNSPDPDAAAAEVARVSAE